MSSVNKVVFSIKRLQWLTQPIFFNSYLILFSHHYPFPLFIGFSTPCILILIRNFLRVLMTKSHEVKCSLCLGLTGTENPWEQNVMWRFQVWCLLLLRRSVRGCYNWPSWSSFPGSFSQVYCCHSVTAEAAVLKQKKGCCIIPSVSLCLWRCRRSSWIINWQPSFLYFKGKQVYCKKNEGFAVILLWNSRCLVASREIVKGS